MNITSDQLDAWLQAGSAAMNLGRLSNERLDLEIRLIGGRLGAGYLDEESIVFMGTLCIEPTAYDWERFLIKASAIPIRNRVEE